MPKGKKKHHGKRPKSGHSDPTEVASTEPDQIPTRFPALIAEVKKQLREKLEEIQNTASSSSTGPNAATDDILAKYKNRFCMSITDREFDMTIFRFLNAHKEDPAKAVEALIATGQFRHRQNIDSMAVFSSLIPIRGYDETEICSALKLPLVVEHGDTSSTSSQQLTAESSEQVLQTELNAFYSASYSQLFEDGPLDGEEPLPSVGLGLSATCHHGSSSSFHGAKPKPVARGLFSRIAGHLNPFPKRNSELEMAHHQDARNERPLDKEHSFMHRCRRDSDDEPTTSLGPDDTEEDDQSAQMEASGRAAADPEAALFMDTNSSTIFVAPMSAHASPYINFHGLLAPIVRLMMQHVPMSFHYWDREGRPVLYLSMAPLRSRALMRDLIALCPMSADPKAVVMLYQAYVMEVLMQLIRFRDMKNQRDNDIRDALLRQSSNTTLTANVLPKKGRVFNAVVVVDCKGVKMKHFMSRSLIQMAKPILTLVQRHYPETLHRLYVVNCQTTVSNVYTALRGVMTEQTRRKIVFCDTESTSRTLKLVVDGDILPEELSGRCHCFGSCLPVPLPDDDNVSDSASGHSGGGRTSLSASLRRESHQLTSPLGGPTAGAGAQMQFISKLLTLKSRRNFKWSLSVMLGEEIIWEFREIRHERITFSVVFVDIVTGQIFEVVPRGRTSQGANHYITPSDGVLILEWSNRRSAFTPRKIRIKLYRDGDLSGFDEADNFD